ncbi:esterase B1-like [Bradysia coprophila]|uniref:esterase B1-like n=1 Tax=Bradysia coprophila TaxID=38358 RepID=UPI00187DB933|nr:esterase B1-like [Bradysia coprophila]
MSPIAVTKYGKVRGVETTSALDTEYISFYGIPYGAAPVGELRFKDPIPPAVWTEVYDATQQKPSCFAMDSHLKKVVGTEDCLNLNIYTKNLQPEKLYPVMFYIFGGGFNTGSNSTALYGPDFLLMSDVVVVVCDYRLGPLGFMSFKDKSLNVPGNAGLKDQLLALKFVRENIRNFGGDPDNVTLFGHSSGAMSVNTHCISDQSKGLFNRAIILSGSVFVSHSTKYQSINWPLRLAKRLGYTGSDEDRDILKFLQSADPVRMAEEQTKIILPEESKHVLLTFAPHVEPYQTDNTFVSANPLELSRKAWGNDIDILIGHTSDEGLVYLGSIAKDPTILSDLNLDSAIPNELNLVNGEKRAEFVQRIRETYYATTEPTKDEMGYCQWKSDIFFKHPITRLIQSRQNSNGKGKTFFFRFAVDSPTMNSFRLARNRPNVRGVLHADELSYYFKHNYGPMPDRESMEFTAVKRFVSLMTSFATTGNPNDNVLNADLQNVAWHPVDTRNHPFKLLNIDENLEFKAQPEAERMMFWNQLYIETDTPLY